MAEGTKQVPIRHPSRAEATVLLSRLPDCTLCPRLVDHRRRVAAEPPHRYRNEIYWARPVRGFGHPASPIWVVGLAPSAHGANRTGRMFTGDPSADFLTASLFRVGLANQPTSRGTDDGLHLDGVFVTAAARCAPPENRLGREELDACAPYLDAEWAIAQAAHEPRVIVALGGVAFETVRRLLERWGHRVPNTPFRHGGRHVLSTGIAVLSAYHPSPQNTNTHRLTDGMLDDVLNEARTWARRPHLNGTGASRGSV